MKSFILFVTLIGYSVNVYSQTTNMAHSIFMGTYKQVSLDTLCFNKLLKYIEKDWGFYYSNTIDDTCDLSCTLKEKIDALTFTKYYACVKIQIDKNIFLFATAKISINDTLFLINIYDSSKKISPVKFEIPSVITHGNAHSSTGIIINNDTISFYLIETCNGYMKEHRPEHDFPKNCIRVDCNKYNVSDSKVNYLSHSISFGKGIINNNIFDFVFDNPIGH